MGAQSTQGAESGAEGIWALADVLGLAREAEALLADILEERSEEEALAYVADWLAENGGAEVLERAEQGAQICREHWEAEADEELLADAEARLARVRNGQYTEPDIRGALDWLADRTEVATTEQARAYLQQYFGKEEWEVWMGANPNEQELCMAATIQQWAEEDPIPADIRAWADSITTSAHI